VAFTIGEVTTKERLHKLVDELTEQEAARALELVEHERGDPLTPLPSTQLRRGEIPSD
jgi:hypothetical protein